MFNNFHIVEKYKKIKSCQYSKKHFFLQLKLFKKLIRKPKYDHTYFLG